MNLRRALFAIGLLWLASVVAAAEPQSLDRFPRDTLSIATPDARLHRFNIWIAANDAHRAQGLMFVKGLPADQGMLFVYSAPQPIAMWMKNTYISLDMIFIRADGRVARIEKSTKPHSLATIESGEPVVAVLEVAAGTAQRLNIQRGAVVMHPAFGNVAKR